MSIFDSFKNLFGGKGAPDVVNDERLLALRRKCWVPVVEDGDGEVAASKFAGIAYLAEGESWPVCPNCGNPIQLFLQLSSDDLPPEAGKLWGEGLLQFFYCTNGEPLCEVDCEAWAPHSKSTVLRVVTPGNNLSSYSESPVLEAFPAKRIVSWEEKEDLPNEYELAENGVVLPKPEQDILYDIYPRTGEKLLGWPYWVQGIEYPNCPKCDTQMSLVFQIDSEKNLPWMFGDVGCGHICQCPEHHTSLAFGWACS